MTRSPEMSQKSPVFNTEFLFFHYILEKMPISINIPINQIKETKQYFLSTIPIWLMENLDFEIFKLNFQNLKIFSGLRNESGPKWVGAQMCWGPNESGPKWVGAQMSQGPKWAGPKWVRGPNEEWAQMCVASNCCAWCRPGWIYGYSGDLTRITFVIR